ncbi:Arc-like DNA binding domain-containing protein [Streptomyces wuyuanensis]|uniref:Arc-like DNA binding domain-containing protein n=2 Tax=Streptomyces TaxID=1883 RepID=A0A1G9YQP8_9ACTN|nr:Arc-like DNA binding domain-containing protein [Streptomyces wuyuanensis]
MPGAPPIAAVSSCHHSATTIEGMDHEVRITLRLPADLHEWLVSQAKSARRSLNSEILHRLEAGRGSDSADDQSP